MPLFLCCTLMPGQTKLTTRVHPRSSFGAFAVKIIAARSSFFLPVNALCTTKTVLGFSLPATVAVRAAGRLPSSPCKASLDRRMHDSDVHNGWETGSHRGADSF